MSLLIEGIGTAVPDHRIDQSDAAEFHADLAQLAPRERRLLHAIYRRSGIEARHSVLLESSDGPPRARQTFYRGAAHEGLEGPPTHVRMKRYEADAPALGERAARGALEATGMSPADISHLVTVSCTGFFAPGLDAALVARLDLARDVERTHVGFMGCHGMLNAFRVARSFVGEDPSARVLVCAVELCTLHFGYAWDRAALVSRVLFSDGAAAVVGTGADASTTHPDPWRVVANGTFILPESGDDMTWRVGDHGFVMTLSARVPGLIRENAGEWLAEWLSRHDLSVEDVASWAVHPGGPRVLGAVSDALRLKPAATDVSKEILTRFGNMSSATIGFILERLRATGAPRPCVALAFGPGLAIEAMLIV